MLTTKFLFLFSNWMSLEEEPKDATAEMDLFCESSNRNVRVVVQALNFE